MIKNIFMFFDAILIGVCLTVFEDPNAMLTTSSTILFWVLVAFAFVSFTYDGVKIIAAKKKPKRVLR